MDLAGKNRAFQKQIMPGKSSRAATNQQNNKAQPASKQCQ